MQRIQAPTLLLWGGQDRMIPSSQAAPYAQVLARSQTVVLPDLGHVLQEERPAEGLAQVQAGGLVLLAVGCLWLREVQLLLQRLFLPFATGDDLMTSA